NHHSSNLHGRAIPFHDYDAALGHVMVAAIGFEVVADRRVFRDPHILVEDGAAHTRAPSDVAVIENDGVFYDSRGVHPNAAAQYGILHHATGEDAASRDDGIDRLSAPVLLVEGELCRWIGIAGGAQRPLAVIEVQRRSDGA